ncbi:MAG: STAS/SEC14 domain-containing protein [Granulosicoccaceae bacterium]
MLSIDLISPNRVDIALTGKIDSDAMKTALDELIHASQDIEDGRMLYRIGDFDFPTLGAIGVKMSQLPELFSLIRKYSRIAVVTDKRWLQKAGELEGKLIPGLDIKAFDADEEPAAEAWLAETI